MKRLINRRIRDLNSLFYGHYIDPKVLYAMLYREIPNVVFVSNIDSSKAFAHVDLLFKIDTIRTYQHYFFDHEKKGLYFNNTIFILKNERIIELGSEFAHVLHGPGDWRWAEKLIRELAAFRKEEEKARTVIGFARSEN